ncbi:hypothetical protein [Amycolatopsis sp. cmx-4-68]|uniref:hypothetical protein n=1 Tax=Amycolatopsis sp. cmx-4-68 TaxID=2790938 RepID=UPI00397ABD90
MSTDRFEPDPEYRPPEPDDVPGYGNQGHVPADEDPFQPLPELDSEDGPPPRRGGPTG